MSSFLCLAFLLVTDVVELKDGTRLVGEVVADKGDVTLRTSVGTMTLPAANVARETKRAELLTTHRSLVASAGDRAHAWLTISIWSVEHGLYREAFDAADRAGEIAPSDPAVASLHERLARDAVLEECAPIEAPNGEARTRLLEVVGGKSPSRSVFARSALGLIAAEELEPWLMEKLKASRPESRRGAALVLGGVKSDRALAALIRASLLDENGDVRAAAREGTLASHHDDLANPYLKAVETGDPRMRERAYPMLEALRDPRAVPVLIDVLKPRPAPVADAPAAGGSSGFNPPHNHIFIGEQRAYVRDFDVQIAQGAVIAKPIVGILQSGSALDVAVGGVVVVSYTERMEVVSVLRRLSGQNLGNDPLAWEAWWARSGGTLPPADKS
jgi:HEAT repeat protein